MSSTWHLVMAIKLWPKLLKSSSKILESPFNLFSCFSRERSKVVEETKKALRFHSIALLWSWTRIRWACNYLLLLLREQYWLCNTQTSLVVQLWCSVGIPERPQTSTPLGLNILVVVIIVVFGSDFVQWLFMLLATQILSKFRWQLCCCRDKASLGASLDLLWNT